MSLTLGLVAAEPSGDALGAGLAQALRERLGDEVKFIGVGGPRMAAYGVDSPFDINELAVLGLVEGLKAYPRVVKRAEETAALCADADAQAVILIDSWGFTLRVAQRLRKRAPELKLIKYVGPQIWASRPGRAKTLARAVDHVLTLQPFEPPLFEAAGLPATFVGHPSLDQEPSGDAYALRARYGIDDHARIVLILFGSRGAEARRLAPVFADAMAQLRARYGGDIVFIAPLANAVATQVRALAADDPRLQDAILVDEDERDDAFAAGHVALACSGTVVSQLALAGVPAVVAYRLGAITHLIADRLVTAPHISLVNMAAGARILPEFVQGEATGEALAGAAARLLDDNELYADTKRAMADAIAAMRGDGGSASGRAADAILGILNDKA